MSVPIRLRFSGVRAGACAAALAALATACAPTGAPPLDATRADIGLQDTDEVLAADRAELQRAWRLRRIRRPGLDSPPNAGRAEALAVYRALSRRADARPEIAAEAAFREGELLRAADEPSEARWAFERVRALDPRSDFAARAGLELGHLLRREERHEAALVEYLAVVADMRAAPGRREEADLQAARMRIALGRYQEAQAGLARLARSSQDPRTVVRAYDEWACSLVADGDPEGGAGVLAACRNATRERALERTELGERMRVALDRMRAPGALAAAVAARRIVKR